MRDGDPSLPAYLAVIGHPVAHSLSPRLHAAALAACGRAGWYGAFDVPPERLAAAVRGLAALGFTGANVTVPHKRAAVALCDELDPVAAAIGAVNTLRFGADGRVAGFNTDAAGFLAALAAAVPDLQLRGSSALVLGAGGAARAVAFALREAGVARLGVRNRTAARAADLLAELGAVADPDLPPRAADLLVNCTSVGMGVPAAAGVSPFDAWTELPDRCVVVDLVYRPLETAFLRAARARGLRTVDGLGMLAHQAALAWRVWFGPPEPLAAFLAAARAAAADA
jgi:shikimate dehydrogenase